MIQFPPSPAKRIAKPNLAQIVEGHGTEGMFPSRKAYFDYLWANLMRAEELEYMFKRTFGEGYISHSHPRYHGTIQDYTEMYDK